MRAICSMLACRTTGASEMCLLPLRQMERGPKETNYRLEHLLWKESARSEVLLLAANSILTLRTQSVPLLRSGPHRRRTHLSKRRSSSSNRIRC